MTVQAHTPIHAAGVVVQRGLAKRWKPRVLGAHSPSTPSEASTLIDRVLAARGLSSPADAQRFLEAKLSHLHDPSLIPDLDRAADRILAELSAGGPIVIYGDYDVDGVTATAILMRTLRAINPHANVSWYIPHRVDEGYGLNSGAIAQVCAAGARVIVSVDCGVTAVEPALIAAAAGVDLIITDHHNPPSTLESMPRAYAIVHPRRPDSTYPFGELSGAGVAYKLAWRLATLASGSARVREDLKALLLELLSLAALGTIADVVPLVGENRIIARYGLGRIQHSSFVGLRALVQASGLDGENVDSQSVGFKLAPRLNACGRMGHASEAAELLTTHDPDRAKTIAHGLTAQNDARRAVEHEIFERACELAAAAGMDKDDRRAIVLADDSWHTGVVGIVCSRMVERFSRPCILLGREDGICHGSGRSIDGFSLHAALELCRDHLASFGGHDMAAGMKIQSDRLPAFVAAFTEVANQRIPASELCGCVEFDADSTLTELSVDVVQQLARLEPFGRENPPVRVRLRGLRIAEPPRLMGATGKHLALRVRDDTGRWSRLVAWNWGARASEFRSGHAIDAVVTPRISTFNGITVEPTVEDFCVIRPGE